MSIAATAVYEEKIAGVLRPLVLRNGEIERFENQYQPFGIFDLWDCLFDPKKTPQARHCRDIIALGLIGGGMGDRAADDLLAGLDPSENFALRDVAMRLLGVTFIPASLDPDKKKEAG